MYKINWAVDPTFMEEVEAILPLVDLVSFDIFDTALTRLVESPCDVFAEVERRLTVEYGAPAKGFAVHREEAEQRARHKAYLDGKEDVTLSMIYKEMKDDLETTDGWFRSRALRVECEVERSLLVPVPEIQTLVQRLKMLNKKFAFVSDMYLPPSFLYEVLNECGYEATTPFVSGESNATKYTGTIWPIVKQHSGVPYSKILHIGDDLHSDVFAPTLLGIKTKLFDRARSERRTGACLTPNLISFSKRNRELILKQRAQSTAVSEKDKWIDLGRSLGFLVLAAFTDWLYQRAKANRINRLYFLSRDGWLLHEAWKIAGYSGIEAQYLYVSRRALNPAAGYTESTSRELSPHLAQYFFGVDADTSFLNLINRLPVKKSEWIEELCEKYDDPHIIHAKVNSHPLGIREYEKLIRRNSSFIFEGLYLKHADASSYLKQEGVFDDKKIGIVDTGWNGTLHRALNLLRDSGTKASLPERKKMAGFYLGLWPTSSVNRFDCGVMESAFASAFEYPADNPEVALGVAILEELCTAPHESVTGYKEYQGKWIPNSDVLTNRSHHQLQYSNKVAAFQAGALAKFAEYCGEGNHRRVTIEEAKAALAQVVLSPSKDELELLGSLGHAMMFDHSTFTPFLQKMPDTDEEAAALIQSSDWRSGLIKYWRANAETPEQRHRVHNLAQTHLSMYLDKRQLRQFI